MAWARISSYVSGVPRVLNSYESGSESRGYVSQTFAPSQIPSAENTAGIEVPRCPIEERVVPQSLLKFIGLGLLGPGDNNVDAGSRGDPKLFAPLSLSLFARRGVDSKCRQSNKNHFTSLQNGEVNNLLDAREIKIGYHFKLQWDCWANDNKARIVGELVSRAKGGILQNCKDDKPVHGVESCLSAAGGGYGKEVDAVEGYTNTFYLVVMGVVLEGTVLQYCVHFSGCSFLGNHGKVPIYGSPATAGRKILTLSNQLGPRKLKVTVTDTKSVQFRRLRHASPEHSVEIVQDPPISILFTLPVTQESSWRSRSRVGNYRGQINEVEMPERAITHGDSSKYGSLPASSSQSGLGTTTAVLEHQNSHRPVKGQRQG
ncbi:hypothetical protein C8R47DRAFT_1079344 [Mycena vitilis]|nr:hypothetical protein C8R47DRAFT_1079344 [Mycena vitilis]